MDENKKEEQPAENTGDGDKPTATTLVDNANAAAERMEKANERKAELLRQEEELAAKKALSGVTEAGIQAPEKKEETPVEYKNRIEKEGI